MSGWTGLRRVRFESAMSEFAECASREDAACATVSVEKARGLEPDNLRVRVAQAELLILAGDLPGADATLVAMFFDADARAFGVSAVAIDAQRLAQQDREVRGAALLALGDLAARRGDSVIANARWLEAASLVDEKLLPPRRARTERAAAVDRARQASDLQAIREDFTRLIGQARGDTMDAFHTNMVDMSTRIGKVSNEAARKKLLNAIDSAQRAALLSHQLAAFGRVREEWFTTGGVVYPAGSEVEMKFGWMRTQYARQAAERRQSVSLTQFRDERLVADLKKGLEAALLEAERQMSEGMLAASENARPEP